jgi:hypothetical protein
MTFKVLKSGRGPLYGHRKDEVVATGLTWQEAHDKTFALQEQWGTSWNFWFTKD